MKSHKFHVRADFGITDKALHDGVEAEGAPDYSDLFLKDITMGGCPCLKDIPGDAFHEEDFLAEAAVKLLLHALEMSMERTGKREDAHKLLSRTIHNISRKSLDKMLNVFANGGNGLNDLN